VFKTHNLITLGRAKFLVADKTGASAVIEWDAGEMLGAAGSDPSIDDFRGILSATHLEFRAPTVYSNICNLTTGDVHVYCFHNFRRPGPSTCIRRPKQEERNTWLAISLM